MTLEIDFTEYDAINILALPLHRWTQMQHYALPDGTGYDDELRELVYSNGTDHGFACERAEYVLDLGPVLKRVLLAGIRALADDPLIEAYATALAAGDHEEIVALEAKS